MKLSSNFIGFHNEFGIERTIDLFSDAGFEAIDFNADLEEYHTDAHDENFYKRIRQYANEKGVAFEQTHAPFDPTFLDEEKTKRRFEEIVKSMKHSFLLGAKMVVVHPCRHLDCNKGKHEYELMFEYNYSFYKKLIPYAEEYGVKVAIENNPQSVTKSPEGLIELMKALNNKAFTVCYDVGHANICAQDPAEMARKLGSLIGCIHVHDNDGIHDNHTLPYQGIIDWESVMCALAEGGYEGNMNYEAGIFVNRVPLDLRPESAKYMAKVGKYLIERFNYYKNR
ncbi:MAG: sugar phosphate isomerase/epimerase [Ruminococcaceae bacterium]|nr:sugar phosphate isomerase/epimerase [Oscillospiraceae bacterium]